MKKMCKNCIMIIFSEYILEDNYISIIGMNNGLQ